MSLRTKLSIGLGFLFLIILALALFSSLAFGRLSTDADKILRDNYDSLVYSRNMLVALDDMNTVANRMMVRPTLSEQPTYLAQSFQASKATFESNLTSEQHNITELHEQDYANQAASGYSIYLNLYAQILKTRVTSGFFDELQSTYLTVRQAILNINDVNMQAIERKNQSAKQDAIRMIDAMAVIGALCILLGFAYFFYFPFYISHGMSVLATRMRETLEHLEIKMDINTKDEAFVLLNGMNLLEARFSEKKHARRKTRS